jgi:uncharacterized membrane protein YcaP (DUF421 family)
MPSHWVPLAQQVGLSIIYYAGVVLVVRLAGKRLAGQVATFDLIILIGLAVVLQSALLRDGAANAVAFVLTVFACHKVLAALCLRSERLRHLVRGAPRVLVREGQVQEEALRAEGMSVAELKAGLRKLGHDSLQTVELATLEETGDISALDKRRER